MDSLPVAAERPAETITELVVLFLSNVEAKRKPATAYLYRHLLEQLGGALAQGRALSRGARAFWTAASRCGHNLFRLLPSAALVWSLSLHISIGAWLKRHHMQYQSQWESADGTIHPLCGGACVMRNVVLAFLVVIAIGGCVHTGEAEDFITLDSKPEGYAWWLRARFHPSETQVRGIPVREISKNWCKASEFRREMFPRELDFNDDLSFAIDGFFDGSKIKQTAVVGAYETRGGTMGSTF